MAKGRISRAREVTAALLAISSLVFGKAACGDTNTQEKPPPLQAVADGDVEVRIHYFGSMAMYSTWLTLRRIGGTSDSSYVVEAAFMAIPQPKVLTQSKPWPVIWKRLESDGFFDLPGNMSVENCSETAVPIDPSMVFVEVQRGAKYRKYSYYATYRRKCGNEAQFNSTLTFLQETFGRQLPVPYDMTGCTGEKCPPAAIPGPSE